MEVSTMSSSVNLSTAVADLNQSLWEGVFNATDDDDNNTKIVTVIEKTVHDIEYDHVLRKAILYVQIVVGLLGAVLLFSYMVHARR